MLCLMARKKAGMARHSVMIVLIIIGSMSREGEVRNHRIAPVHHIMIHNSLGMIIIILRDAMMR